LVVKEMAPEPRWKAHWNLAQEHLATGPLGLTRSAGGLWFIPPDEVARWMVDAGLAVETFDLARGYAWPHHLFVGQRRSSGTGPSQTSTACAS
jgi:hypothetical protein